MNLKGLWGHHKMKEILREQHYNTRVAVIHDPGLSLEHPYKMCDNSVESISKEYGSL